MSSRGSALLGRRVSSRGQDSSPRPWQCQIVCVFAGTTEVFLDCVVEACVGRRQRQECTMESGKPQIPCVHKEAVPGDAALRCWTVHCWQVIYLG